MRYLSAILVLIFILTIPTSLTAFDDTGMSMSVGSQTSDPTIGCYDTHHDFYWNSVGVFGRSYLNDDWYIDSELDVGHMKWLAKESDERNAQTLSLEGRLMFMANAVGPVDLGLGGGFAFLSDKTDTYRLTKDGFYGLITLRARLALFNEFNREYGIDLEADHISSVFGKDPGMNVWKLRFYIMF